MIRLEDSATGAEGEERHGLDLLVDLSRLLRVTDPTADVVTLGVVEATPESAAGGGVFFPRGDGRVVVTRATCREAARLACAADEQESDRRTAGRPPTAINGAARGGFAEEPVLAARAGSLREAALGAAGAREVWTLDPWPEARRWAVALTHDIDVVTGWPVLAALRVAELSRRGRADLARRTAGAAARAVGRDPVRDAVDHILAVERRAGAPATWFAICERPSLRRVVARDVTYHAESRAARRILDLIGGAGHEIGLHGSFDTAVDRGLHRRQRETLQRITGSPIRGVRQHFLRMDPPRTQRNMQAAGFAYDASWGFPDRSGFRLGVSDVVPAWDAERRMPLGDLQLVPFAWMDRTGSKYAHVEDAEAWVDTALATANLSRASGGVWVGLWHPYLAPALGFAGADVAFERLVTTLAEQSPYFGTLEHLVAWRGIRRGLRAERVRPDEALVLTGDAPEGTSITATRRDGRRESFRPRRRTGGEAP